MPQAGRLTPVPRLGGSLIILSEKLEANYLCAVISFCCWLIGLVVTLLLQEARFGALNTINHKTMTPASPEKHMLVFAARLNKAMVLKRKYIAPHQG